MEANGTGQEMGGFDPLCPLNHHLTHELSSEFFLTFYPSFNSRSLQNEEPTAKQQEASDLKHGQFNLFEQKILMREACQFAQFQREHPFEKWTVGSLPNLYSCSFKKCMPRYWEL